MKKILSMLAGFLFMTTAAFAQSGTLSGTVTDQQTGEALPQVNVFVVELLKGDATDFDGRYEITAIPFGTYTLRVSSIGYVTVEQSVTVDRPNSTLNLTLAADLQQLEDVVVTAFGISRDEKSLGYAVQTVGGDAIARVEQGGIGSALAGKVAGLQVIGTSGANLGGSEKIRLRGANGLSDGQPLFVIDGTPIANTTFAASDRGRDYGNLISDLNLQNVESISVLKGAAASALYGNRASNGVILITTKRGQTGASRPMQVDFSNRTYFENVYVLPDYQNEYAGGYVQDFIPCTDPKDGQTYNCLNYAADESWGPKMDGRSYRPWYSWFNHDFDGDGQSDYGKVMPLNAQPNNVRDFFETGVRTTNDLSITGGSENISYRVGVSNTNQNGVMPNSELGRTSVSFNGALNHNDKFTSSIAFNYTNTQASGRPTQGYSPSQGNPMQMFNQWFQRQIDLDLLKEYNTADGLASWNIRSPTNLRPLYWDSPYFSVYENVSEDDRDRIFGNYKMQYNVTDNLSVDGSVHLDAYDFTVEDRIGSGGLDQDWYSIVQRTRREVNYQLGVNFNQDFDDISVSAFGGANLRQESYSSVSQATVGGLSTPNYFNIAASVDRPSVGSYTSRKDVRSVYGTATVGYQDIVYIDGSVRNDWSSSLPNDENSYLYYGLSTSFVFTELSLFDNQNILSFGKLRASIAQVGDDIGPYQIYTTYSVGSPYGSNPTQSVPNTLKNPNLRAAISSDIEFGADLRFLNGRIRTDVNYYQSIREDEILSLTVPGSSGYSSATVNAGKFTTNGIELQLGATVFQNQDWNVDLTVNWATSHSEVNELAEGLTARQLEAAYFGLQLYAIEGQEWGTIRTSGGSYGGYTLHENGGKIMTSSGVYRRTPNKEIGNILPDYTGGFIADINYKNFNLSAAIDFQKGGKFYTISKMFGAYSGMTAETVGNNVLGNPMRDPVLNKAGEEVTAIKVGDAASNSGGVYASGVDENGNPVEYLTDPVWFFLNQFYNKEAWVMDASYIKLREVKITYNVPVSFLADLPIKRASVAVDIQNPLLIYASTSGVDPSAIQNSAAGFSFWEGGTLPGTRAIGFNVNIGF